MGKDGISFQPKMSTNKQIKVRTQVLCKDLRYPVSKLIKVQGLRKVLKSGGSKPKSGGAKARFWPKFVHY